MILSSLPLPAPWDKRYRIIRAWLLVLYFLAVAFFLYLILFPSQSFQYNFRNPRAARNTILDPRTPQDVSLEKGQLSATTPFLFDTAFNGLYSHARVIFNMEEDTLPSTGTLTAQRSFRSFFYPEGPAASFPAGTLLKHNQEYFIVSPEGKRVRFASLQQIQNLNYRLDAFIEVSNEELALNEAGPTLDPAAPYPDGTLFHIDNIYYQLHEGKLHRFVSEQAYLTRHTQEQAVPQNETFLQTYAVADDWLGFRSGTLLAFADGVFMVLSDKEIAPIGSEVIFTALGLDWNDVLPGSEEEIGIYERGKIILEGTPHPDGTVFVDSATGKYFLINNKRKQVISSETLRHILLGSRRPIPASVEALSVEASCSLVHSSFFGHSACDIPLEQFRNLPGNTYRFSAALSADTHLSNATVKLKSAVNSESLRASLSRIKQRILMHYGYNQ
jgi:hypothetical protein